MPKLFAPRLRSRPLKSQAKSLSASAAMKSAATLVFVGRFEPESFSDFVNHRARRLTLSADLGAADSNRVEVHVEGDSVLVDAFEMACSLGPIDCLVLDTFRVTDTRCNRVTGLAG